MARADWYDKGYLANIVTYTIAKLVHEAERQGGGRHIDLMSVWNAQSTPQRYARCGTPDWPSRSQPVDRW